MWRLTEGSLGGGTGDSIFRTTGTTLFYPILELVLNAPAGEDWVLSSCLSSVSVWLDCVLDTYMLSSFTPNFCKLPSFHSASSTFITRFLPQHNGYHFHPLIPCLLELTYMVIQILSSGHSAGHHQIDPCSDLCSAQSLQPSTVDLLTFVHHFACCCF